MQRPNERFSPPEFEPDPQLQLSQGRASGLQIAIVALACTFILGLMVYGLNQPVSETIMTSAPPAPETTGAAAPAAPQSGGNVAGGENAAPKSEIAPQEQQPAQQPVPQQTKPGAVEDDSTR